MQLLIADTFTAALARLTGDEQKAVKTTVFDLQVNAAQPGLSLHKLDRARDKRFWSARVSGDLRIIVHRSDDSLLVCYVDHHDKAYEWAERRKLEVHPKTGAAQFVEIRETSVQLPLIVPKPLSAPSAVHYAAPTPLFAKVADAQLLEYGVPEEWIAEVRTATEDSIFTILAHLPSEAAEALIELATGGTPKARPVAVDPFTHPDAQRRFRVTANAVELEQAMAAPWERWSVFLHPSQREVVDRRYAGPARVAGSAGTGKTVVAMHRAVALARSNPEARVLLTTFSIPLARMLRRKLDALTAGDAPLGARLVVDALDEVVLGLYEAEYGRPRIAKPTMIATLIERVAEELPPTGISTAFLTRDWADVVDAWQLTTWEQYRDVPRLGRKQRLSERQRQLLWSVFAEVLRRLEAAAMMTIAQVYRAVTESLPSVTPPFSHVVVDEAQDIGVAQLRFLAAVGGGRPDALFFAGDQGQRIFQLPFSWKSQGVDIRGRSHVLRVNYRTSHQIRRTADRLLDSELHDVDGVGESRRGTVSVFDGPAPEVVLAGNESEECDAIAAWLRRQIEAGVQPGEIGVIVRSRHEIARARSAVVAAGLDVTVPPPGEEAESGRVVLMPMHLAKGLEFRAVAVVACDDSVLPYPERIESVEEETDLEDVYITERYLLYVACTRAREALLVTAIAPGSEFLGDFDTPVR